MLYADTRLPTANEHQSVTTPLKLFKHISHLQHSTHRPQIHVSFLHSEVTNHGSKAQNDPRPSAINSAPKRAHVSIVADTVYNTHTHVYRFDTAIHVVAVVVVAFPN